MMTERNITYKELAERILNDFTDDQLCQDVTVCTPEDECFGAILGSAVGNIGTALDFNHIFLTWKE